MRVRPLAESHRLARAAAAFAAFVLQPALASAQEAPKAKEGEPELTIDPRPNIDVTVAPPPPPVQRTYQVHEGFYVRADIGLGTFSGSLSGNALVNDIDTSGTQLAFDLLLGGGLAPGIILGGGAQYAAPLSGDWEVGGTKVADGDMSTLLIGPFIDGFPDAKGGWHFGGLAGLSRVTFDAGVDSDAIGFGGSVWAGHDFWVAPEWSVGGLLRASALRATENDVTATKLCFTLAFTALMN
jgi:hypothetical protein